MLKQIMFPFGKSGGFVAYLKTAVKRRPRLAFLPQGGEAMCAYQLEWVFSDKEVAQRLLQRPWRIATVRNDCQRTAQRQFGFQQQVLEER
jgi:hypothetical protein